MSFFKALRTEVAFYIACLNLHARLTAKGEPVCFPVLASAGEGIHHFNGLYDACLSLQMQAKVVGNTVDADGKTLIVITGANQGGRSTFLRSIGPPCPLPEWCVWFVWSAKSVTYVPSLAAVGPNPTLSAI